MTWTRLADTLSLWVQDLARAHIFACTTPLAANRRFLITHGQLSAQEISDVLRKRFPEELVERTPIGPHPGQSSLHKGAYDVDTETTQKVLEMGELKNVEDTLGDWGVQLLALEKGSGIRTIS